MLFLLQFLPQSHILQRQQHRKQNLFFQMKKKKSTGNFIFQLNKIFNFGKALIIKFGRVPMRG